MVVDFHHFLKFITALPIMVEIFVRKPMICRLQTLPTWNYFIKKFKMQSSLAATWFSRRDHNQIHSQNSGVTKNEIRPWPSNSHTRPITDPHWTFTFWATTAISKAITGLICWHFRTKMTSFCEFWLNVEKFPGCQGKSWPQQWGYVCYDGRNVLVLRQSPRIVAAIAYR